MSFEQVASLIKHVGQFGSGLPKRRSGQIAGLGKLDVALPLISRAAHLLSKWPRHFHQALTETRIRAVASASLKRTYGSLYRAIYIDLHEPCFQFLRDTFDNYVRYEWPNLIAKRNRRLSSKTIAQRSRRPLEILARETGVSRTSLKRLASRGLIAGSSVRHASGRTTWAFPKSVTKKVRYIANDNINLKQTAKLLGVSKPRVREMIDAGLIKAWIRADSMRASAWSLCKQDVVSLLRLCKPCRQARDKNIKQVSLRQVMQTWRLRKGELPALLKACNSGALSYSGSRTNESSLSDLSFNVEALRTWLDVYRSRDGNGTLSVNETAKFLGVKQQVAYELVRAGLLETVRSSDPALRGARITMKAISEFTRDFVSLSDLSKLNGCRSRTLLSQISAEPVFGPNIDGSRHYFYKRSDIAFFL